MAKTALRSNEIQQVAAAKVKLADKAAKSAKMAARLLKAKYKAAKDAYKKARKVAKKAAKAAAHARKESQACLAKAARTQKPVSNGSTKKIKGRQAQKPRNAATKVKALSAAAAAGVVIEPQVALDPAFQTQPNI